MKCNICLSGEMEYLRVNGTHVYICEECPNVQLEYHFHEDVQNLHDYLHGKVKAMTREEQLKYDLSEYISFSKYDGNDSALGYELKLLLDNGEEIASNFCASYRIEDEEELVETLIEQLTA